MSEQIPILPAATVVILRKSHNNLEVLLLLKSSKLSFASNCWVFPGGKVDQADLDQANHNLDLANQIAAARECIEETGLDISNLTLLPISHWTTPNIRPKRFATQFFLCEYNGEENVLIDDGEIVDYRWITPSQALQQYQQRKYELMPPTVVTLTELARFENYTETALFYTKRLNRPYQPKPVFERSKPSSKHTKTQDFPDGVMLYEGDSGYEEGFAEAGEKINRCVIKSGVVRHECNLDIES